jgi:hypothetical protein
MSLQYSPKITTDGLVMCLDASQNKSYPTDLPVKNGLLVWLDAADDTTFSYSSGTEVSQWRDKSGNNFHANQATVANQPSRNTTVNSRKSVNFTSTNGDRLRVNSGMVFTNSVTAIVFIKPGTQNFPYADILDQDHAMDGYNGWVIQRNNDASQWLVWLANEANTTWLNTNAVSYADNTPQIVTLRKGSSTLTLSSNGTSSGDVAIADQQIRQANYFGLNIGSWRAGNELFSSSRHYNGEICEIVVYNRALSLTELKQVHTYLGQKWGISNTDRSIIDLAGNDDNGLFGNGTVANMPAYDFYNKGTLRFDGSNDYVFLSNSQLNISSTITVEVWVKYNAQGGYNARAYSVITCKGYPWTWLLEDQSGQFNFRISTSVYSDSNVNSSYSHGLNAWNHVVGTYDGVTQKIYVDGVLRNSVALNGTINTSSNDALVGSYNYGDYCLTGNVGAVRVYNKALSATEIAQNYEAQKSKFANTIVQQGLVLNLDAGNPYSYAGAGTTWIDVSGASSVAEFVGGPAFSSADNGTIYFDGGTSYCAITPSNNFAWTPSSIGLNNMTIDLWLKSSDSTGYILSKPWNGSGEYNYYLYFNGFFINTGNQSNAFNFSTVTTGNWINLVILVSTTQWGAYINGVQNVALANHGITNNTPTYGNTQTQLTLMTLYPYGGGGNAGFSTQGNIGSFRIYNRVLSASEVLQNYNATKGRFGL